MSTAGQQRLVVTVLVMLEPRPSHSPDDCDVPPFGILTVCLHAYIRG